MRFSQERSPLRSEIEIFIYWEDEQMDNTHNQICEKSSRVYDGIISSKVICFEELGLKND